MRVATTRLMTRHAGGGMTIMETLRSGFDYKKNPNRIHNGDLILAYGCDPDAADAEFLLSKARYRAITGREQKRDNDVLYYQTRQTFPPGKTDPETALKTSYDLAMRWTKGRHASFVVSHVDRPHPHYHIYYNPTSLDCTRKSRDFIGSARAMRRLSDRICFENRLSVITSPEHHSKGEFKHYGEWFGGHKPPILREKLGAQIGIYLATRPPDMNTSLRTMMATGCEIKQGRDGAISFRAEEQKRFAQLRTSTLGKDYGQEDIQAAIGGRTAPQQRCKVNLTVDTQSRMKARKDPAYERWTKVSSLKQMAATLQYLQGNGLIEYTDLEQKATEPADHFHMLSNSIKSTEAAMRVNAELKAAVVNYIRTRSVFEGHKTTKYNRKYLVEHEADIATYRAARDTFRRLLFGAKLPKMDTLKTEFQRLSADRKKTYWEYRGTKRDMQEIVAVKSNISHLLDLMGAQKNKGRER